MRTAPLVAAIALLASCSTKPEAVPIPCDSKAAFDTGNQAFKAAFPGSNMNFPFYRDSLVVVKGDSYTTESWTVVDGRLRYEFYVTLQCVDGALQVKKVDRKVIPT